MANQKTCIFLVDDEPIQNEMLKDYIAERFDFDIKTYDNGEEAIANIGLNPEIIVLDFHLNAHLANAKNGVEVLKALKELKPDTQVIMLSGQDKLEVAVESMKYGAYDYIIKGETAFSRIENVMNNILEFQGVSDANKTFKNIIVFMGIVMLAIILASVYMIKYFGSH
jgi:two-component system, OmpR family, response regulator